MRGTPSRMDGLVTADGFVLENGPHGGVAVWVKSETQWTVFAGALMTLEDGQVFRVGSGV